MPKIVFYTPTHDVCTYYRTILPILNCYGDLIKEDIQLLASNEVSPNDKNEIYVFHRIIKKDLRDFIYTAKCAGKKIIWETDDDVFNIPVWNPFTSKVSDEDLYYTAEVIKMADTLIVSTEELKKSLESFEVPTYVLPNLIEPISFSYKKEKPKPSKFKYTLSQPVEIMWAGSVTHDEDLKQASQAIIKLIEKYKEKIHFTFMGYLPTELAEFVRLPGSPHATLSPKYERNMCFYPPIDFKVYYDTILSIQPDIGIAPLYDCKFNHCKSNLKSLEYLMADACFVGSDLPPYQWITEETGILTENWFDVLSFLIENESIRHKLAENGKKEVLKKYSWLHKEVWLNGLREMAKW